MIQDKGYVLLFRKVMDNWVWDSKPFSFGQAWMTMVLMANHKGRKVPLGTEILYVRIGSFITSQLKLMERFGWKKNKLIRFLKLLESDGMINIKTDHKKTMISICNYKAYRNYTTIKEPKKGAKPTKWGANGAQVGRQTTNDRNNDKDGGGDHGLQKFVSNNFNRVVKLEKQLTRADCLFLETHYDKDVIKDYLGRMENHPNLLKNNTSVFFTIKKWMQEDGVHPKPSMN